MARHLAFIILSTSQIIDIFIWGMVRDNIQGATYPVLRLKYIFSILKGNDMLLFGPEDKLMIVQSTIYSTVLGTQISNPI